MSIVEVPHSIFDVTDSSNVLKIDMNEILGKEHFDRVTLDKTSLSLLQCFQKWIQSSSLRSSFSRIQMPCKVVSYCTRFRKYSSISKIDPMLIPMNPKHTKSE